MAYWKTYNFVPFDDTETNTVLIDPNSAPTLNTKDYDSYRQGIELKTTAHIFRSTQPKMWGGYIDYYGNIIHEQDYFTKGQAVDSTEFDGSPQFAETTQFNLVDYMILGRFYPMPIYFNGGCGKQEEAIIELFTIPFRLPSLEGSNPIHAVKGGIDSTHSQIYEVASSSQTPFLDEGEIVITSATGSVSWDGYTSPFMGIVTPFDDMSEEQQVMANELGTDTNIIAAFRGLNPEKTNKLIPFGMKSSTAGYSYNDPYFGKNGTDSIAFGGWLRGS